MTNQEDRWGEKDVPRTQMPPEQPQEQRAHAGVQQSGGVEPAGPQGPGEQFGSGAQSMPTQSSAEGATQQQMGQQQSMPATPMVDIVETPEEVVVYVDAPGYGKDHIQIHADANTLAVSADRSSDPSVDEDADERGLVVERPMRLERTISLPVHVDPEEAEAAYEDGVTQITIPKEEEDKRREIGFQ